MRGGGKLDPGKINSEAEKSRGRENPVVGPREACVGCNLSRHSGPRHFSPDQIDANSSQSV